MQLLPIKAVVICLCLAYQRVQANILVYRLETSQLIAEFNDLPAQFGPSIPSNGLKVYPKVVEPINACSPLSRIHGDVNYAAIIQRGGNCSFELKVRQAQAAGFEAAIIFNNLSDDLEQMSAKNSSGIKIPAVFIGRTSGRELIAADREEYVLVINDELPFNINTQLILPFSILMGLCFLIMIFYMVYKCIREERRLRRYRLPKRLLKKLPIIKYAKNNDLAYETCVICLEDFAEGDRLRILPCRHPYHSYCIDPWLTENRRVCPICKRKVFTKGEARTNRNRQSSLDSVTDTDDDTTPLLQPSNSAQRATPATATGTGTPTAPATVTATATTRHGTFRRGANNTDDLTSDDDNVLSTQEPTTRPTRRINPFDRTPNLPPYLAEQLNENRQIPWYRSLYRRLTRRPEAISVAAPAFLEQAMPEPRQQSGGAAAIYATPQASNNIMNPNLSGSFKDDEHRVELENDGNNDLSIYEPNYPRSNRDPSTVHRVDDHDALSDQDAPFIQTPSQGGIGVAALPNHSITMLDPTSGHRTGADQFLV